MKGPGIQRITELQLGRDMALRYFSSLLAGFAGFNKIEYNYYKQFLKSKELEIITKLPLLENEKH